MKAMKTFMIGLLTTLVFASAVHSQKRTDVEATYAMTGPVKSFRTEMAYMVKKDGKYFEGARTLRMTASFNEDGVRTELGIYNDKGLLVRRIVTKAEDGRAVEFLNYDGDGKMYLRVLHFYEGGIGKGTAVYNGDGSLQSRTTAKINDRGQWTELLTHDAQGTLMVRQTNSYDEKGELKNVERSSYSDGSLSSKVLHDVRAKRTETFKYNSDGSVAGKSVRVNQEESEYAADGSLKKSTFFSPVGRLAEELNYNVNGNTQKQWPVQDEIDAHGNWTKLTRWISDAQGTRPISVTYRSISYY